MESLRINNFKYNGAGGVVSLYTSLDKGLSLYINSNISAVLVKEKFHIKTKLTLV